LDPLGEVRILEGQPVSQHIVRSPQPAAFEATYPSG
jgi:hypothetical protein